MKHKKVILLILGLMLSICLFFGISYAFWLKENTQDIKNIANSGCFNLSLTEETSSINIDNLYPIKDEESTNLTPYTFTLKNTCNYNAYYEINLETLENTNIDLKFLKASLNNNNPKLISEFPKTSNIIANALSSNKLLSGYLTPGNSATYSLRIWMSYDTTLNDVRNDGTDIWQGKITIKSSYVSNETLDLACVNAGGDRIYDGECRKYYVKLNEQFLNNDFSSANGWELWNNEDGKNTAENYIVFERNNLHFTGKIQSQLWQRVAEIPEHVYYIGIKVNSGTGYFGFNNIFDDNEKAEHHWQRTFWLYPESQNSVYIGKSYATGKSDYLFELFFRKVDFNVSYRYINVIDLTLMFGEGHEPDKEWCDKYLTEFIEYNKEGTLTPIKEIGAIVPTAYYETISLTK